MTTALLFPGQGSQRVGMGRDLAHRFDVARRTYDEADAALGFAISRIAFDGPEDELTLTQHSQPAILATSMAVFRVLSTEKGLDFAAVAGHSLGEWTALAAAGALSFADAIRLVHLRGQFMQDAVPVGVGAMAALMGLDLAATRALCAEASRPGEPCEPANLNGGGQIVISGHAAAIDRAIAAAKGKGAKRAVKLAVSAPFHCSLMQPAADRLAAALAEVAIAEPRVPVYANVTAQPTRDPATIRRLLVEQVTGAVRWEESIQALAAAGVNRAFELGSGSVLRGLVKRIADGIEVTTIGEPHEVDAFTNPELEMATSDTALHGKVALVTGGSRGIGRAICVALARRGAKVIVNYAARRDAADETAALVTAAGGTAAVAGFDVADANAAADAIKQLGKDHGGLDILVNNAGVAINGLVLRYKDDQWQRTLAVNLSGAFNCARAAASLLLRAKEAGRIINITSVVGESGNAGQAAYAASKAGLIGLTTSLAKEFASRGVTVNAVSPGFIDTDMTAEHLPEAARAKLLEQIPLARIGVADDVAHAVAFLAGPEAGYITGQVLRVNGGLLV